MTIAAIASPISAPALAVVDAPARLHLGFLDPDASLGRRFASLGLAIDGMSTRLSVSRSPRDAIETPVECCDEVRERLARYLTVVRQETGIHAPVRVVLHCSPPTHAGFGSGTQLALAFGRAFGACLGRELETRRIAALLARGRRSGVGIGGFERGGLLLDGGPRGEGEPPPLLARMAFPRGWRVLLVLDERRNGLHGADERAAMGSLAPFPRELAAELCHQVVMRVLPGAMESEFEPFAEGVSTVQRLIGDYFAPVQGGSKYTSPAVAQVLEWIEQRYCAGIGQSSWGPTGFAILPSSERASEVVAATRAAGVVDPGLRLMIVSGRNDGARFDNHPRSPLDGGGSV